MNKKDMRWGWLFLSPHIIGLLVFFIVPVLFLIYISFTEYNLFNPPVFVGMKNYISVLTNQETWYAFRNVGFYALIYVPIVTFLACILAVALNQKLKSIALFRVFYFLPSLIPWVAVSLVWLSLFNPIYGVLNYILAFLGLGPFNFTFSQYWFEVVASIAIVSIWKGVGYASLYVLAGLQNISDDIMEAAEIDGAGIIKRFFKITLPLLTPTIFMLLIFGMTTSLQIFDAFLVMLGTGGITSSKFSVINMLIYNNAFQYNKIGTASAICWVAFVFVLILTLIQKKMEKRWVHYE